MKQYLDLLKRVLVEGAPQYNDRTGQLMIVKSGDQSVYDLRTGFPQSTTKPSVPVRWVAEELFWMLRGEKNAKTLYDTGVDIWNRNAFGHYLKNKGLESQIPKNTPLWEEKFVSYQEGMKKDPTWKLEDSDLGPVYGFQWRHWPDGNGGEIDQVTERVINSIKKDKGSRYHMLTAWNVADIKKMALAPCHCLAQFTVTRDKDLDLNMFQRSCDTYLGVPFNIASYSLLNHLVAKETGLNPRLFIHSYGNVHLYAGISPRSNFLKDEMNLVELQQSVRLANSSEDYLKIREWYLKNAPEESPGNERKDHIPYVLEQLSKQPQSLPTIQIADLPFEELIRRPAKDVVRLSGYNPLKWDSKAVMAA